MRHKDDILLENLYQSIYIKEAAFQLTQSKMLEDVLNKTSSVNHAKLKYELTDDDGSRLLNKWLQSCTDETSQVAQQSAGAIMLVKDLTNNGEQVNITQQVKAIASKPINTAALNSTPQDIKVKNSSSWVNQYRDLVVSRAWTYLRITVASKAQAFNEEELDWVHELYIAFSEKLKKEEKYKSVIGLGPHGDEETKKVLNNEVTTITFIDEFYIVFKFIEYVSQQLNSSGRKIYEPATIIPHEEQDGIKYKISYNTSRGVLTSISAISIPEGDGFNDE